MTTCTCDIKEQHPSSECVAPWQTAVEIQHLDLLDLLTALGLGTHARPYSMHAVIHRDILPAIRALTHETCNASDCTKKPGHMGAHE